MDEPALATPSEGGWAVKDHLVHIAAWEHWLLALFEHRDRMAAMGAAGAERNIDAINAVVYERHRNDTSEDARRYFKDTHAQLMAVLDKQTTADFERPYSPFFDANAEGEDAKQPVLVAVAGNTYEHYPEHVPWIKEQRESREPR